MTTNQPEDYFTKPLELFTVKDLTDALGIKESTSLLSVSARAIYTVRNTNQLGYERVRKLIEAVQANEDTCRKRLVILRNKQQASRRARTAETAE